MVPLFYKTVYRFLFLFMIFHISACSPTDNENNIPTGMANIQILVPLIEKSSLQASSKPVANTEVPDELTNLLIQVLDQQQNILASADIIGTDGQVTLVVKAGQNYIIRGTAKAGDEILFQGETLVENLQSGSRNRVNLTLEDQVSISLNTATNIKVGDGAIDLGLTLSGLNNKAINWYVNGILGGSAELGFIDEDGRYTPPSSLAVDTQIVIRAEPVVAPSFFEETTISLLATTVNTVPVANNGTVTVNQNESVSGILSAIDPDNDTLTYSIVSNGSQGNVVITDVLTGAFIYTPNIGVTGDDNFTFRVTDGKDFSNVATVSVTIGLVSVDTDGDGLLDSVETNTGIFVSEFDTGSDPNVADSDGDNYSDGEEVLFLLTDPNDINSIPITTSIKRVNLSDGSNLLYSASAAVNADGSVVVYSSNFVSTTPVDQNGSGLTLYMKKGDEIKIINLDESGNQPNGSYDFFDPVTISDNGNRVAFSSGERLLSADSNSLNDVYMRDVTTNTTVLVSSDKQGNAVGGGSGYISGDGRYIAFSSSSDTLVTGDTNGTSDVFVKNNETGEIVRVSVDSNGGEANDYSGSPVLSRDGRFVAFASSANNLVANDRVDAVTDIFRHDRDADGNGVFDEPGGIETIKVSVNTAGETGNSFSEYPSISADGNRIAFTSLSYNLADGVPRDLGGEGGGIANIFLRDIAANTTELVSADLDGVMANKGANSNSSALSADGRYVVFSSNSTNLVVGNLSRSVDVYVKDMKTGSVAIMSVPDEGGSSRGPDLYRISAGNSSISADGRYVVFQTRAANLVENDVNQSVDIFMSFNHIDRDGDRLSDYKEFLVGSDPVIKDTDGDMAYDGAEVAWGFDPLVADVPMNLSVPFSTDFESDDGGFTATGLWQYGTPTSGPGAASSGMNAWATNLNGAYAGNQTDFLYFPVFVNSGATAPILAFSYYMDGISFEDYAYMEVSLNNGKDFSYWEPFDVVAGRYRYPDCCDIGDDVNVWDTQKPDYARAVFHLYDEKYFEGQIVQFRLRMEANSFNSTGNAGMYIDDVYIGAAE